MNNTARVGVCAAQGYRAAVAEAGLKVGRPDVAVIVSDTPAQAAGMFTTNLIVGAPVTVSQRHIKSGIARAIVVNAGNANTCTGEQGELDAIAMCTAVGEGIGCDPHEVLVASTGVIGRPLPMDRVSGAITSALATLLTDAGEAASHAILTTDSVTKTSVRTVVVNGVNVTIGGMAKGAGMIAPKLATMLAFITTDAEIPAYALQVLLRDAVSKTFNRVTVDGDTSTSDMVLLLANGAAGAGPLSLGSDDYTAFSDALFDVCSDLALAIARDGEGATKFVTVQVTGAPTVDEALLAARTVAESPLCKTAIFGGDPNWGRIAAALGRSGVVFNPKRLRIWIDDLLLFENGTPAVFELKEAEMRFAEKVITIRADLGAGRSEAEMYTCDFSPDYISINADYTT